MLTSVRRFCAWSLVLLVFAAGGLRSSSAEPLGASTTTVFRIHRGEVDLSVFDNSRNPGRISRVAMGDLNGDGLSDLLLGAPFAFGHDAVGPAPGVVYVIYAGFSPDFVSKLDLTANGPDPTFSALAVPGGLPGGVTGFQIKGEISSMRFGSAVASGDFDGDGVADFAVSAPRRLTDQAPGRVYIVQGNPIYQFIVDVPALRRFGRLITVLGPDRPDDPSFGDSLLFLDLDNDARDDLVIGSPKAGVGGEVHVVFGQDFTSQTFVADMPPSTGPLVSIVEAEEAGDEFGTGLAAGDLSGDGRSDLIVGAPLRNANGTHAGQAYVFFGADRDTTAGLPLPPHVSLSNTSASLTIVGPQARDTFGHCAAVGDFDGNGWFDLAVGAPFALGPGGESLGKVYVIYGDANLTNQPQPILPSVATTQTVAFVSPAANSGFGTALAAGPFDEDVLDDLMIGAPNLEGRPGRLVAGAVLAILGRDATERPFGQWVLNGGAGSVESDLTIWAGDLTDHIGFAMALEQFDGLLGLDLLICGEPGAESDFGSGWLYSGRDLMPFVLPVFENARSRWSLYR